MLIKATIAGGGVIPHIHKNLISKEPKKLPGEDADMDEEDAEMDPEANPMEE